MQVGISEVAAARFCPWGARGHEVHIAGDMGWEQGRLGVGERRGRALDSCDSTSSESWAGVQTARQIKGGSRARAG